MSFNFAPLIAEGRAWAETMMLDTCDVKRRTAPGLGTQDPDTGTQLPNEPVAFTSKCKVQQASRLGLLGQIGRSDSGGREALVVRMTVHLPIGGPAVESGDIIEITAVGPATDAEILGKRYRIVSPTHKSLATSLRYEIEEVTY